MKKTIPIAIALLLIAGAAFYWYEWRPSKIRHNCSWVHRFQGAVPAKAGKTQEEIDKCEQEGKLKEGWGALNALVLCGELPQPAQPAKDWWQKASPKEYESCLHEKGISN